MIYLSHVLSVKCPLCRGDLKVGVSVCPSQEVEERYGVLVAETWQRFLLWNFLGKPSYGYEGRQYWYDPYHNYVKLELGDYPGKGTVYFAIQIVDSVDGDTWLLAKVPLEIGRLDLEKMEYQFAGEPSIWRLKEEDHNSCQVTHDK